MADSPPTNPAHVKLRRARQHLEELESVFADLLAAYEREDTVSTSIHQDGARFAVHWQMRTLPVPDDFGAIVGDVIHNLRAGLDLLAAAAAIAYTGDSKGVYFPFSVSETELDGQIAQKKFHKAGPAAVQLVKDLMPYHGGNTFLRAIHDLDIADKHQKLIPQTQSVASPILDTGTKEDPRLSIVGDSGKPSEVSLRFPKEWPLAEKDIIQSLHRMLEISAGIIESFEPLLAPPADNDGT